VAAEAAVVLLVLVLVVVAAVLELLVLLEEVVCASTRGLTSDKLSATATTVATADLLMKSSSS
jgi:hypothetical protein